MVLQNLTRPRAPLRSPWIKQYQLFWWLEIKTAKPDCIYWFGPFTSSQEARFYLAGYVEDLVEEQAEGISI